MLCHIDKIKILLVLILCLSFFGFNGCSHIKTTSNQETTISEWLIYKVNTGNKKDFTTALFLLSHLSLNSHEIEQLDNIYKREKDSVKKLFIVYTLYQRTMEQKYENSFIALYPVGKQQKAVWDISRHKTDYINVSSPLQKRLATFAITNKAAFQKLLSAYKFADGADGDSLSAQIAKIYKYNPDFVLEELHKKNIDLSEFGINKIER